MKCKKIGDLLKSDYLDGELSDELRLEIERHLKQCSACRLLKQELASQRIALRGLEQREVPTQIWQNIQNAIIDGQAKEQKGVFSQAWESFKGVFYPRRPAFVLASTLAVFIIVLFVGKIVLNQRTVIKTASDDDFLTDYRLNGFTEGYNFGTEIEEYFL